MQSNSIQKLIDLFSKFPTIGPKTAARFVYYLIGLKKEEVQEITNAVSELKKNIKTCAFCFKPFEGLGHLCEICSNPGRDKSMLCVVEKEPDLNSIEKTKKYRGRYFILGGTISRLRKKEIEKLRIKDLVLRVKKGKDTKEIILAINPTAEGEATTLYLERLLKPYGKKTTRLGRGLPIGGELEYADEETLASALESRK
ncbi:MAG: recombination mediator RecR [Parcubacteria group bacterium]